jgi:hypothetical protein
MIKTYPIKRWDSVINHDFVIQDGDSLPALYVLPDKDLLESMAENKYRFPVKIIGTVSCYDEKVVMATCKPVAVTAGFRPNFQEQTGLFVIIPELTWSGYPENMGSVKVMLSEKVANENENYYNRIKRAFQKKSRLEHVFLLFFIIAILFVLKDILARRK